MPIRIIEGEYSPNKKQKKKGENYMEKQIVSGSTKIKELENKKWHFGEAGSDKSNEFTGVMYDNGNQKLYIEFSGMEFEGNPFRFWFKLSEDALNLVWEFEFNEKYTDVHKFLGVEEDFEWIDDIMTIPYTMLNTLSIPSTDIAPYMGEVDDELWEKIKY